MAQRESLTIAMLTYRRNAYLADVLPALVREARLVVGQGPGDGAPAVAPVRVLVIDNDPAGGAAPTVRQAAAKLAGEVAGELAGDGPGVEVVYVHEPEPGIVAGRNRALDESADQDLLAFIDDDETPSPGWLAALLATRATTGADAVTGPTPSRFETEPEPWVTASGLFESWDAPDGAPVTSADTGNLLLDLRFVRAHHLRFDPRYGLSGGEDSLFSRQLVLAGGSLRFARGAVVTKRVPPARATRAWVRQRAFRNGSSWSRVRVDTHEGARLPLRLAYAAKGLAKAGLEATRTVAALARHDLAGQALHETTARGALGMVVGAFGADVREYARTGGSR